MSAAGGGYEAGGASYAYDGEGRRVRKRVSGGEVTVFVYDAAGRPAAEYSNRVEINGTSYLTQDPLGSTRVVTGQDGAARGRYDYLPFGGEAAGRGGDGGVGVRQRFTGKERDDEIGLDYFLARYYSSGGGRFVSADPVFLKGDRLADPQRLNLFTYVRNNPFKYVDPTGEDLTITVTNIVVGASTVRSHPSAEIRTAQRAQQKLDVKNEVVNAYKVIVRNETGQVRTFQVTRDTNRNGSVAGTRGDYGSGNEAPPGSYSGHIRQDGRMGFRVELTPFMIHQSADRKSAKFWAARNFLPTLRLQIQLVR